jgi:hypothetical protein
MKLIRPVLVLAVLLAILGAGCRTRPKKKNRYEGLDGGYIMREECNIPSINCHDSCYKRSAGIICAGCCRDQSFLCDTQQDHSFESCESVP